MALSFTCFRVLQFVVRWYLFGKCTFRTFSYFGWRPNGNDNLQRGEAGDIRSSQSLLIVPPNKKWRTSNEAVSLIHSVLSGLWALYACLAYPQLVEKDTMVSYWTPFAYHLILLSGGYTIHDLIDLLINEHSLRILELFFHHVIVLVAFGTTLFTGLFLGVVVLGLLMELNSIFLHSRSLMNLYGVDKTSTQFRIVALLNIVTFMVFRMAVSAFLLYWQVSTVWRINISYAVITFIVIASLTITNTVLCYRVLAADGLLGKSRARLRSSTKSEPLDNCESNATNAHLVDVGDLEL
uniref:TLC domain-containing protein n=1 Tax=Syphacia muris TaxID=451379 RepID=A0A0N5ALS7_9BILA